MFFLHKLSLKHLELKPFVRHITLCETASMLEWFELSSRAGKIWTGFAMVHHRFNIHASSLLHWRYDSGMGTANSLHASA